MAAYKPYTRSSRTHRFLHVVAGDLPWRRLAALTILGWLFAAALILGLSVTGARASTSIDYGWETGDNSQFSGLECAHPSTQFQVVTSPVRDGRYAARVSETANDVWNNGQVRCLDAAYGTGESTGSDYYFGLSMFIPAGGLTDNLIWELHQPYELYSIPGCGVAPFAILVRNGVLEFRAVGGDCIVGSRFTYWDSDIPFPNLNPYPKNKWIDFVIHINFQESNTGTVQVWGRTAGDPWTASPQIQRTNIPTMPFCSAQNVHNVKLYTTMGLYPGYAGYNASDTVYLDSYRRGTSFGDVAPGGDSTTAAATAATTTTASTTAAAATTTTTPTPAASRTTTTTTTRSSGGDAGPGNGRGRGGPKRAGSGSPVRLLTGAQFTAPTPSHSKGVKVLSVVVQAANARGLRVTLIDQANRKIPFLKHTLIGSVPINYWRKNLTIGKLGNGRVSLHLRVAGVHLRHQTRLRLRVQTLGDANSRTVVLAVKP